MKSWNELTVREQLVCEYSDMYKDVHGFRPRHLNLDAMTVEVLMSSLAKLEVELKETIAREKQERENAIVEFEATITRLVENGADDRQTAIRWLMQGHDTEDTQYLEYLFNIPFNYIKL